MSKSNKDYDIVIIGGGPAGLSAAIYAARSRRSTLLLERGAIGGQIINAELVENYPGYAEGVSGIDLTQFMHQQAEKFGLETVNADVTGIKVEGERRLVETSGGGYAAKAVIIAAGSERQKLGVPGEEEYTGRGVSYCATCDGAFFRDKDVAVVGGGDAAITEALELTRFASRVTVIHRRNELRATGILRERALAEPKIAFLWDSAVAEINGETFVNGLKVKNLKTGQESNLEVAGAFISVGFRPNTAFLKGVLKLDDGGSAVVNERMETSVPGIFAAGDIRSRSIRQVVSAAGAGATAAVSAEKYLSG